VGGKNPEFSRRNTKRAKEKEKKGEGGAYFFRRIKPNRGKEKEKRRGLSGFKKGMLFGEAVANKDFQKIAESRVGTYDVARVYARFQHSLRGLKGSRRTGC